jgi:RNA-directed DNA polymerase
MSELLEKILDKKTIDRAYQQISLREGAEAENARFFAENWDKIQDQIRQRSYTPQTPAASMTDRIIQQGIAQILSPVCEAVFSEHCYGFQPDKNCEMAVCELLRLRGEGYLWVVDIGLQNFYENEPEDRLMSLVHNIIHDGDTESLIRKYLKAGIMTQCTNEQETSLPVLLMNVLLNELDKELENRGLRFVRCADDCVVAVKSESSAKRVMCSVTDWIQRKLGFGASAAKIKIARPAKLKYLRWGYFTDIQAEPVP